MKYPLPFIASLSIALLPTLVHAADEKNLVPGFAFELRMSKEDYQKEVAALDQDRLNPAKVEASAMPAFSTYLVSVTPGSQADRAGIAAGWRATTLNGRELWHHLESPQPDASGKREITFVSPKGERKRTSFEPGTMGYFTINSRRPEAAVLRLIPRGAWDRDMMVAAVAWPAGDHELAETALRVSMNRGMPAGTVLYHYASLIALDRGDTKSAKELNARVMNAFPAASDKTKEKEIPRFYREGIREVGLSLGDYRLFARANRENEGLRAPAMPPGEAEQWIQWSITDDHGSLLPGTLERQGPDLLARSEKYVPKWQARTDIFDFTPLRDGRYVKTMTPGHFDRQTFAPPGAVRDMAWHIRFSYRETGKKPSGANTTNNFFYFALMDRQEKAASIRFTRSIYHNRSVTYFQLMRYPEEDRHEIAVSVGPSRTWVEVSPNIPAMSAEEFSSFQKKIESGDPSSREEKRRVHQLSMIRSGGGAEIILNGRTLIRGPVDPQVEDLYPVFQMEGMSIAIDGMTVHEIKPE